MSDPQASSAVASSSSSAVNGSINAQNETNGHITEDEASLYDRQIRLWGLEAQNRMRNSTVLILSLRSLAHETIKNLVLAGIGRLIIMDDEIVTEEDLSGGFLFREEEGAVGKSRTTSALPQISSLNPLVTLDSFPTLSPFINGTREEIVSFLQKEKVDIVVACDLQKAQLGHIDDAARIANTMFYAAGTYGFYGYVFTDLGESYEYVANAKATPSNPSPGLAKFTLSYPSIQNALSPEGWVKNHTEIDGSPFSGLSRNETKNQNPAVVIGILALWEYENRHGTLPTGAPGQKEELLDIAEGLRNNLGVNTRVMTSVDAQMIDHLASHATHPFPPTLAILGGFLAQDVLRALSKKDTPIVNLLAVDSLGGLGVVSRWGMSDAVSAPA